MGGRRRRRGVQIYHHLKRLVAREAAERGGVVVIDADLVVCGEVGMKEALEPAGCGWTAGSNESVAYPLPLGMNMVPMKEYRPGPRTATSIPTVPAIGARFSGRLARLISSHLPLV